MNHALSSLTLFILAGVCVAVAAIFVACEVALTRVSKATIEQFKRDGHRSAGRVLAILDDRARHVNVVLFIHLALTIVAYALIFAGFLQSGNQSISLVLASVVMIVVGYIILGVAAQTIGRQHSETVSLVMSRPVRWLGAVLWPLTKVLILIGNAVTPGKGFREGPFATQAEFRELVDRAGADAVIEDDERQMIHSVFELGDTVAREVMVPRTEMVWIEQYKTLRQAMSLGLRSGYSRIPVIGQSVDDVVGVVYLKDIASRVFEHHEAETSERVSDIMRPAFMVPDSRPIDELLHDMQTARTHMAVLVDEYGGTAGLVTIEDVIEEIVGDISDEYDLQGPEIQELASGGYRVSSRLHVDDLAELLGITIDDEGVDTATGLMAKRLGIVPIAGAQVRIDNWILTAESVAGRRNRIGTVLIEPDDFLTDEQVEPNE